MTEQCDFLAQASSEWLLWLKLHLPEYLIERTLVIVTVTLCRQSKVSLQKTAQHFKDSRDEQLPLDS